MVAAATSCGAMAAGSASANTMPGALPPSSRFKRLSVDAALAMMRWPTGTLPVKLITSTSGEVTRASLGWLLVQL